MLMNEAVIALDIVDLPLEKVREIFNHFRGEKRVTGMVAMNISRRSSIDDKEPEKSGLLLSLLRDLSEAEDMENRWAVAKNRLTPVDVLEKLAKDPVNLVRALVATNPHTPTTILRTLFSDEKIVRDGLSGNPSTPEELLSLLLTDTDKMVRMRVAENPGSSTSILKALLEDGDLDVRRSAQSRLKERSN
ncbi:MAG TPA: hypothetical protein ENK77_04625 [Epsilonproteobacteria bacterium]|nr:hypothetical protein [Campylobacterota bacterium]